MKNNIKKILLSATSLIALSSYNANAQWAGSPINTYTNSNVGIGLTPGPANDANLQIENRTYPSHPPSTFTIYSDLPAQKIQRNCYLGSTLPKPPSDIFEIWHQLIDEVSLAPIGNNKLDFFVDNQGLVGINKISASATLDVGGNANIDNALTVGADVTTGNDVIVGNKLKVTNDASIGGKLNVVGASTLNSTLTLSPLASGSNKLPILDNSGTVTSQNLPTLGISGSKITLSNGGSISSTITLPAAPSGDDLGNHTAKYALKMAGNDILNANRIESNSIAFYTGTNLTGTFTAKPIPTSWNFQTQFTGTLSINCDASASYDLTMANGKGLAKGWDVISDKRLKKNIEELENVRSKVFLLNAYQYDFIKSEPKEKLHFGFLAQDVQKIFPNLTTVFDGEGHISLNYIEIIPLLLQTLKEEDAIVQNQGEQIELLKKEIELLKNKSTNSKIAINESKQNNATTISSMLNQNVPNPFGKETVISFSIAGDYEQAFIGIYNLNGQELKKINISKGQTEITLNADQLEAGMYVYSLIVNNNLIDSKKMVISK